MARDGSQGNHVGETCQSLDLHSEARTVFSWEADETPGGLVAGLTPCQELTDSCLPDL